MVPAWSCVLRSPERHRSIFRADVGSPCSHCIQDFIMAQNYMFEFWVDLKSQECAMQVLNALVVHGFSAQDIVIGLPEKRVFVPITKSVQELLHIIRMTGRHAAYVGLRAKNVEWTYLDWHPYWP